MLRRFEAVVLVVVVLLGLAPGAHALDAGPALTPIVSLWTSLSEVLTTLWHKVSGTRSFDNPTASVEGDDGDYGYEADPLG